MEDEFSQKITGYCLIYAPYYILFLESDDGEFMDHVCREIQGSMGNQVHENVWCLFATEEVPERAFNQFEVKSYPSQQSQAEIKNLPQLEKVSKIYSAMLEIGTTVTQLS